jgi:hypothetical protein
MSIIKAIKSAFRKDHDEEIVTLKLKGRQLDRRISELERQATINGEEGWFFDYVRRDPSCALKVLRECDKNGNAE